MYVVIALMSIVPVTGILFSYSHIVSSLMRLSCIARKYKAFSSCGSHLCVVFLYFGTELGGSLSLFSYDWFFPGNHYCLSDVHCDHPMLNPFIYSLRNKGVKGAFGRLRGRETQCHWWITCLSIVVLCH
jgi:olfactory receptor